MNFEEKKFKEFVKPHILKCRDGDWNHAKRVVKWVKKLGGGREDLSLLITAGYIHDIGWREVLPPQKLSFEKLLEYENEANSNSETYIGEVLGKLNYSDTDISEVLRLVQAADKYESQTEDEAVIVDADSLSKLDINHLKEKFKRKEWHNLYELWKKEFPTRIKTSEGKKLYPSLLERLFYDIEKSS